jgi:plasmid stabilization system protein ParE
MKVIVHPEADLELENAIAYYRERGVPVAESFVAQFEVGVEKILRNPELYPVTRAPAIRKHVLRQFPYNLIYRAVEPISTRAGDETAAAVTGQQILGLQILAIAHHKRRPFYWAKRV